MAFKKKTRKSTRKGLVETLLSLGVLFTCLLFFAKLMGGKLSWLEVFAPFVAASFISFIISILKTVLKRI